MIDALNKLCKWRTVLAGWHTGSKALLDPSGKPTPGVQAMRDLMDKWLIMRVDNSAMAAILIKKGICTAEEFTEQVHEEARHLDKALEQLFPGFRSTEQGMSIDIATALKTMRDKGFPE
jgi:hypothetical protein